MRYRILGSIALGLLVLAAAGVWVLQRVMPRARPETSLAAAAANGTSEELRRELKLHAPDDPDDHGFTALVWAARSGQAEAIGELARAGADPDRQDGGPNGWTPLLHAVHKNQRGSVRALIAAGADVDRPAPNGITPLMLAASQAEEEIVEELLASGADPHARQPGGETVLTHAVIGGDARIVRALLNRAPDLRMGDTWEDRAARLFARARGRSEVLAAIHPKEDGQ